MWTDVPDTLSSCGLLQGNPMALTETVTARIQPRNEERVLGQGRVLSGIVAAGTGDL